MVNDYLCRGGGSCFSVVRPKAAEDSCYRLKFTKLAMSSLGLHKVLVYSAVLVRTQLAACTMHSRAMRMRVQYGKSGQAMA